MDDITLRALRVMRGTRTGLVKIELGCGTFITVSPCLSGFRVDIDNVDTGGMIATQYDDEDYPQYEKRGTLYVGKRALPDLAAIAQALSYEPNKSEREESEL